MYIGRFEYIPTGKYSDWKPILAEEGFHQCVYCALPDATFGERNFHVEHYKPKSRAKFKHLENDIRNLFYACPACNVFKSDSWPRAPKKDHSVEAYPDPSKCDYCELFKLDEASGEEPLLTRVLAIREEVLGSDHPSFAVTLNNLALFYVEQGKFAQAEPLYLRSLAILEKTLGPDHPHFAASLNNLGALYRTQEKLAQAKPFFLRSLAIREKALGSNHPDVAMSLSQLARLYTIQGKYAEAESLFKRGLEIIEKSLTSGSSYEADLLEDYSQLLSKLGREAEAIDMKKRAEKIRSNNE